MQLAATTPIGSAVFAIPPGCAKGEYLGQALLQG
jgi:dye decolorizing peroxidase